MSFKFTHTVVTEFEILNRNPEGNLMEDLKYYNLTLGELGHTFRSLLEVGNEGKPVYVVKNDPSDPANEVITIPEFFFDDDPDSWDDDVFKVVYGPIEWRIAE